MSSVLVEISTSKSGRLFKAHLNLWSLQNCTRTPVKNKLFQKLSWTSCSWYFLENLVPGLMETMGCTDSEKWKVMLGKVHQTSQMMLAIAWPFTFQLRHSDFTEMTTLVSMERLSLTGLYFGSGPKFCMVGSGGWEERRKTDETQGLSILQML